MNSSRHSLAAGFLAGAFLATAGIAADATKADDELPSFDNNYIKLSGVGTWIKDSESSYQAHMQRYKNGANGIEDVKIGQEFSKDTTLSFQGTFLPGPADYLGKFLVEVDELGSVEVGYKSFRTFYDGVGGFFPNSNQWMTLTDPFLHVDRAMFWTDIKVALPDKPVVRLKYTNELRNGRKDTTIWGDSDMTGIPIWSLSSLNPISANRKISAAYMDLNERNENLALTVTHTLGKTSLEGALILNRVSMLDTRYSFRYPGELKPYPAIPSSPLTLIPASLANNPINGFDQQGNKMHTVTAHLKAESEISERLNVFGGVSYQVANGDITGWRQMTLTQRTAAGTVSAVGGFVSGGRPPYSYMTLGGAVDLKELSANVGARFKALQDLTVTTSVKAEETFNQGVNQLRYTSNLIDVTTGALTSVPLDVPNTSRTKETAWTPEIDLRYTGLKRVVLYANADYRWSPGSESFVNTTVTPSGPRQIASISAGSDRVHENHGNYKVGANWTVSPKLTLRSEAFVKNHVNAFDGQGLSDGSQFLLDYETYGVQGTAVWKVLPTLTSTTKYVGQSGRAYVTTDATMRYQSVSSQCHMLGETLDWNPRKEIYVQLSANLVFDKTRTSYQRSGGSADWVLHNADNNYWNSSFITGFVVDKHTDAELQATHYKADNYQPSQAFATVPYGTSVEDYTITVGVKRKLTSKLVGEVKVGWFDSKNDTTGGNANFRGTLAYVSLTQAF